MSKKILIVDDDPGILKLVSAMIKREGYTPLQAVSGQEALAFYTTDAPDLILLDLAMPGMNGAEVLDEIRKRDGTAKHTPVVLLTAHGPNYFRSRNMNLDADSVITKPVTLNKLRRDLDRLL